jgi:uncharacterized protein
MKLDVKSLVNAPVGDTESLSIELFKEQIDEEVLAERIRGNVILTKLEDEILARFTGNAKLDVSCDRCAGDMSLEIPFKFSQEYVLDKDTEDEDKLIVSNRFEIELIEPLRQELLAAIPVKKLCKDDCAGICLGCGANLNSEKCTCKVTKEKKKI